MFIKKLLTLWILCISFVYAEIYEIENFTTNLLSKSAKAETKTVEFSFVLEGRDIAQNDYKIFDAINIVSGSFYAQDLITSKAKENFKKTLISYLAEKEGIGLDKVYITRYRIIETQEIDTLLEQLQNIANTLPPK